MKYLHCLLSVLVYLILAEALKYTHQETVCIRIHVPPACQIALLSLPHPISESLIWGKKKSVYRLSAALILYNLKQTHVLFVWELYFFNAIIMLCLQPSVGDPYSKALPVLCQTRLQLSVNTESSSAGIFGKRHALAAHTLLKALRSKRAYGKFLNFKWRFLFGSGLMLPRSGEQVMLWKQTWWLRWENLAHVSQAVRVGGICRSKGVQRDLGIFE